MAQRKGEFLPNHYYHVFNRGVNRQQIFFNESNYLYLLKKVKINSTKYNISVIAFCLMPNHFHFLLKQIAEEPISRFMQAVFNSYTKAINLAYNRSGTLFQGPFKSTMIDSDEYLIHLCRYIHRNPLEAGFVNNLEKWPYSNYLEWIGKRTGNLVDLNFVKEFFPIGSDYEHFVLDYQPPEKTNKIINKLSFD